MESKETHITGGSYKIAVGMIVFLVSPRDKKAVGAMCFVRKHVKDALCWVDQEYLGDSYKVQKIKVTGMCSCPSCGGITEYEILEEIQ